MKLIHKYACLIDGKSEIPPIPIPEPPYLLPIQNVHSISYRGSTGAQTYLLLRSETTEGPWIIVGQDIVDSTNPYKPFDDGFAQYDQTYYYVMIAKNSSGNSALSNVQLIHNLALPYYVYKKKKNSVCYCHIF